MTLTKSFRELVQSRAARDPDFDAALRREGIRDATPGMARVDDRMVRRITRKRGAVFLRADFSDLGSYDQIGRALRRLVARGILIKIGQGLYARARKSPIDGRLFPEKGLDTLKEAVRRLGVETVPTRFERAYNSGQSEQVPTGRVVGIRGKQIRRKIGYDGTFLGFERAGADRLQRQTKPSRRDCTQQAPITVREALHLIWKADCYPILGNGDWRTSVALEKEALDRAGTARTSPDDPPEFAGWLAILLDRSLPDSDREAAMSALYDLFDPEDP